MNNAQLRKVMKFQLRNLSTSDKKITDTTIHNTVLSDSDGFGSANSMRIYKSFIRYTIIQSGHEDKPWPKDWMKLTVAELSNKLIGE